jgi:hypothetical protein
MKRRDQKVKKSEWSDKQLEELLRQMPKIHDHRNPRDIYQNLSIRKRRRPVWVVPGFATAAALLLFFLLVPRLLNGTDSSFDNAKQESASEEKISLAEDNSSLSMKKEDTLQNENGTTASDTKMLTTGIDKTALYDDEVVDEKVITFWIPDSQAQILVPVSTMVKSDENKDWLTIFTESMAFLKEEEWGLSDFYPLNATFQLDSNNSTVTVDLPSDHQYGQGSAIETIFITTLKYNIASNSQVDKIKFTTNGNPGIELGNYGVITEIEVEPSEKHAYFFHKPDGMDTTYMVPSIETYPSIDAALEAMKTDPQVFGLTASLADTFAFKEVDIKDKELIISMDENITLENNLNTVYAFEAILLTAKEFGIEKIMIVNAPIELLGPFDLSKEINVPLAANFRQIP